MLSGKHGTLSAGRVLSCVFAVFTVIVLGLVTRKALGIIDPALLHEWVEAFPALGSVCLGLTGIPYGGTK